jgi:hypothetical protein
MVQAFSSPSLKLFNKSDSSFAETDINNFYLYPEFNEFT